MCKYETENGICELCNVECAKVFICSHDGIWIDRKDEENNEQN